jgi:hypothetical protein
MSDERKTGAGLAAASGSDACVVKPGQYQCAWCNGIFDLVEDENWSSAKAKEEHDRDFPGSPMETSAVICDDCYQKCRPDTHPKEYEAYKAAKN